MTCIRRSEVLSTGSLLYRQTLSTESRLEHHCSLLGAVGHRSHFNHDANAALHSLHSLRIVWDATSFTLELGSAKPFGSNDMTEFASCRLPDCELRLVAMKA